MLACRYSFICAYVKVYLYLATVRTDYEREKVSFNNRVYLSNNLSKEKNLKKLVDATFIHKLGWICYYLILTFIIINWARGSVPPKKKKSLIDVPLILWFFLIQILGVS